MRHKRSLCRVDTLPDAFWDSPRLAGIRWRVIFDADMPSNVLELAPPSRHFEYVYMLFDDRDWLLYVGRSFRPSDRINKHRPKAWGHLIGGLVLVRIDESPEWRRGPGPNTARFEAVAIDMLNPIANIAAASRMAML